jgi:hypothetical protein
VAQSGLEVKIRGSCHLAAAKVANGQVSVVVKLPTS